MRHIHHSAGLALVSLWVLTACIGVEPEEAAGHALTAAPDAAQRVLEFDQELLEEAEPAEADMPAALRAALKSCGLLRAGY